jgi:hypothetical protein
MLAALPVDDQHDRTSRRVDIDHDLSDQCAHLSLARPHRGSRRLPCRRGNSDLPLPAHERAGAWAASSITTRIRTGCTWSQDVARALTRMPIRSCGELAVTSRHDQGAAPIAIIRAAVENGDHGVPLGDREAQTRKIPCYSLYSRKTIPCSPRKNSLLGCVGNFATSH